MDFDKTAQFYFARWDDGYYYPGIIGEVLQNKVKFDFLDGNSQHISKDHILKLQEAFDILSFEGNYQNGGSFYEGTLSSYNPMIITYNDGIDEQVELIQLRGYNPDEFENCEESGNKKIFKSAGEFLGGFVRGLIDG